MSQYLVSQWGPALLAFVTVAFAVLATAIFWEWFRDWRRQREIRRRLTGDERAEQSFDELFRDADGPDLGLAWLDPFANRLPHLVDLQNLMDQAGVRWHVGTFVIVTVGCAVAMGMAALLLTNMPLVALVASILAGVAPYTYIRRKKAKRMEAFLEGFPEAIDLLGRAIRAGHAFSTGLQMIAEEADEPVGEEFQRVFEEQKFGLPLDESLFGLADRIDLVEVQIFVTAVLIQREVGGNLAEILDTLATTIRERFMIERQVKVYTAQGRLTGYLLAVLPIALAILITMLNREYIVILIEEPVGRVLIAAAAVAQITGYLIIRRIVNIKV